MMSVIPVLGQKKKKKKIIRPDAVLSDTPDTIYGVMQSKYTYMRGVVLHI